MNRPRQPDGSQRAVVQVRLLGFTYCDLADAWAELALVPLQLVAEMT